MPDKGTKYSNHYTQLKVSILFFVLMLSSVTVTAEPNKHYLVIEHNIPSDKHDLGITSVGMLSLEDSLIGSAKLSYLNSGENGKGSTLDLGGGYTFRGDVSPYLLLGISLGYNWDENDYIAAYYPEVGVVIDFTETFGMTISGKRYFNLYDEDENIVILGLVFRK